ncbi:FAD binding domain protein [Exophiala viscosa]|uniref:FAD binding domain protein n=1 Tax=Exophiala viscosa TaxID=2486360 RepID=A0AAN6IBW5_9EURO|nr:FAD binding domain protein [Exophiala viscosa]KAI1623823.1 FAD binding domain protein [Exophiala viscosa]
MKVLICGGGIAGPALAFWLSKLPGYDITLVERFSCLRASGQQIDLRGHGIQAMKRMGLEQAYRSKSVNETGLQFVDSSGQRKAFFPANKTGTGLQSFTTNYEIMRGDLCRLLYDATKDRVRYLFGTTVESFEDDDRSIKVQFTDGSKDWFDLLVGADGQGSRIRRMILPPESPDPFRSLHMYMAYFTMSHEEGEEYVATGYLATNKRLLFTRRHSPNSIQAYMGYVDDDMEQLKHVMKSDVGEQKKVWAELFRDAGWQADRFITAMQDDSLSNDFFTHEVGQVRIDSWSRGRVVLLGDAAYCPSAATGMGTSASLVGAYVLAGEIAKHLYRSNVVDVGGNPDGTGDPLPSALAAYQRQLKPFVSQVQNLASGFWIPSSPWGITVFNFLVGLAARLRIDALSRWVFREDVRGWDLPEYPELARLGLSK